MHLTGRAALNWNYRLLYLTSFFKALHIKLVTCLEQIILCTFSTDVQSVSSLDIFSDALVSNYCISILKVFLHTVSLIKNISHKLDIPPSPSLTIEHFSILKVHFKSALAHRTRQRFWTMFTYGFLFAWWSFSWHLQMARRIVFTDSGFWKYSWAHLVMSMTESCRWVMQCRLRARRPRASSFSKSFDDVMHCR